MFVHIDFVIPSTISHNYYSTKKILKYIFIIFIIIIIIKLGAIFLPGPKYSSTGYLFVEDDSCYAVLER